MAESICPQCGKTFVKKCRGKQKFCSKECCGKYMNAQKTTEEKQKEKEQKTSKKVAAGSSIAEISRLAREAHMTYGQYVAVNHIW